MEERNKRQEPKFASDPVECRLQARINDCEGCNIGPCAELVAIFPEGQEIVLVMMSCAKDAVISGAVTAQLLSGLLLQRMDKHNEAIKGKVDEATNDGAAITCDMIMRHAYGLEDE